VLVDESVSVVSIYSPLLMAGKKSRGSGLLRALNLIPFLPLAGRAPMYARLLWALASDPRVPAARKALLGLAGAYIVAPIDIIPERIPFVGALDDVAVMVLAIDVFLEGLPDSLVDEKLAELGIPRSELDSDLARVRRLIPRPVRALVARVPGLIDRVAARIAESGVQDRVRAATARRVGPQSAVVESNS
jgi:uncharacterized membrane protein YkvA (DUF1232 family)